jgi:hypothetical protein
MFNVVTLISLGVFLSIAVLWPLSYRNDIFCWDSVVSHGWFDVFCQQGELIIRRTDWESTAIPSSHSILRITGFGYIAIHWIESIHPGGGRFDRGILIPCWFLTLVSTIAPTFWYRQFRNRRLPAGFCKICGYDLRATPDRCPECGTLVAKA